MSKNTLLLLSEKLNTLQKSFDEDIHKGKSNRDGLIQQVITYVRDGRTITRKQWVRSEFADHAKKNEEEKKEDMIKEKERKDNARKRKNDEMSAKKHTEDVRGHKKIEDRTHELTSGGKTKKLSEMAKKHKKLKKDNKKDEKEKNKKNNSTNRKNSKSGNKHTSFGQQDQTRKDNKAEQNMMQN